MNVSLVQQLHPFQRLVFVICRELWQAGYDVRGATDVRIERLALHNPRAREALNACGFEYRWPLEERRHLFETVRYNMAFREAPFFVFGGTMDLVIRPCVHRRVIYCSECWKEDQKAKRKK